MNGRIDVYEPVNTLKPVDQNIWIVDGPVIHFKKVPFTTRMTVVRLGSGDLFVHSPTLLTPELKSEIDSLGPVRHLISPNKIHYWWIGEWGREYPDAIKWASPGVHPSAIMQGWEFDKDPETFFEALELRERNVPREFADLLDSLTPAEERALHLVVALLRGQAR